MVYVCPICHERVEIITTVHLKKHGLTMGEFKTKYSDFFSRENKRKGFALGMVFLPDAHQEITADHDHHFRMINKQRGRG